MPDVTLSGNERQLFNEAHTIPPYLMNKNSDAYVAEASKKLLEELIMKSKGELNRTFGGANAKSSEIGFMPIQPWHIGGSNVWLGHVGTLGWITAPSTAELAWGDVTIPPETWIGILGFEDYNVLPKIEAVQMTIGNETLQVQDIQFIRHAPGNRVLLPYPITILPKSTLSIDIKVGQTGYHEFKPIGWAVTRGSNLSKKSYYSS